MRDRVPKILERGRIRNGPLGSDSSYGFNGAFQIDGPFGGKLLMVVSDGVDAVTEGWEHVSVSAKDLVPSWDEMKYVKDLCWKSNECVVQFHPPESQYVNNHPNVLHLWRHRTSDFRLPPQILVGIKELGELR